jgi:hypothetical protein
VNIAAWRREPRAGRASAGASVPSKIDAPSKEEAIRKYCEYYYDQAESLAADLKMNFRFVDIARVSDPEYQSEVLSFVGIPRAAQVLTHAHVYNE